MTEIWKDIKGYKGIYMVSNMGRVKSLPQFHNSNSGGYYTTGKILKQRDNGRGYSQVRIYKKHFYSQITFLLQDCSLIVTII